MFGINDYTIVWNLGKVFEGEVLRLKNVENNSVFKLECIADNGIDEALRKSVTVTVHSKQTL